MHQPRLALNTESTQAAYTGSTANTSLFKNKAMALSSGAIYIEQTAKLGALILKNNTGAKQATLFAKTVKGKLARLFLLQKPIDLRITYITCGLGKTDL